MARVRNVIEVPLAGAVEPKVGPVGDAESGTLRSGHTRVFAKLAPADHGQVKIHFSVSVDAVTGGVFASWRQTVITILGAPQEGKIATFAGLGQSRVAPEAFASRYALATLSYVATGDLTTFDDKETVPFGPPPDGSRYQRIVRSIHALESKTLDLTGTLVADIESPKVDAYITATYFEFGDQAVTSFVGYSGPLVVVDGAREIVTRAGLLAPTVVES